MASATSAVVADDGPARVSGTHILDQMEILRDLHGADHVRAALEATPSALRTELDTLTRGGWCSVEAARVFKSLLAARVGDDTLALQRQVVRAGIERTFGSVWRALLSMLSDARLARGAPMIYARTFDHGRLELTTLLDHGCVLTQSGWPEMDDFDLTGLTTGIEGALSIAGRKHVKADWRRVEQRIEIKVTWR